MPLINKGSRKAFQDNMRKEMDSGKPQDQSLAIAYEIQRKNKRKKMSKGGLVMEPKDKDMELIERDDEAKMISDMPPDGYKKQPKKSYDEEHEMSTSRGPDMQKQHNNMRSAYADGGMVDEDNDERNMSTAERIMSKKAKAGEQADIDMNGKEMPNDFYHLNEHAALDEDLDSDLMDVKQPIDSNLHGDDGLEEDVHDMVSKIRSKMRMKRGM